MNKLDKAIKEFNLIYTDTIAPSDMSRTDYLFGNQEVNYENSISLKTLRDTILSSHKKMLDESSGLAKLEIGNNYEVLDYLKSSKKDDNSRELKILLDNPSVIKDEENFLFLVENAGRLSSYVTNGYYPLDDNYKKINLNISDEMIKKYLDLFGKYKPLLDYYNYYKSNMIYEAGNFTLCSSINTERNRFNSPIRNLEFYGHIDKFLNEGDSFTINTHDNGKINLERSSIILNDEGMRLSVSDYNHFIESIFISKNHLNKTYNKSEEENFEKILKLK